MVWVCDLFDFYGNEFTSWILHECTNHSDGYIVDPVSRRQQYILPNKK